MSGNGYIPFQRPRVFIQRPSGYMSAYRLKDAIRSVLQGYRYQGHADAVYVRVPLPRVRPLKSQEGLRPGRPRREHWVAAEEAQG